ncbi:MAG: isovaleryl-CoA dehydrogenase, partial [Rhizobacter sp.]|nr:isovaleryl-CoA dehydrogenase [Rhizobacter sp.]
MTIDLEPQSAAQRFSGLSNDEQEILDQADRFAKSELYPLSSRMDNEEWWPPEAFAKIGATGYFGVPVPETYGGAGLDLFASALVVQAFSR